MALSGVFTITNTAHDIVEAALRKCQAIDPDQDLELVDLNTGLNELNRVVKFLQSKGANLWKLQEAVLFLDAGKTSYQLGPSGDEWCDSDDFVSSTLSAAEASGQSVLSITSTAGMADNDVVGIELDDGTRHWTTITVVNSGVQISAATPLPSDAAAGRTVYTYTTAPPRPLRLMDVRWVATTAAEEIPVNVYSRQEYLGQTDKTSQGQVVQCYYQPTLDNGLFYVWQPANSVNAFLRFSYQRPIEVFSNTSNNPDFPAEWYLPLVFKLASVLAPEYKTPRDVRDEIRTLLDEYMADVEGFDEDLAPIQVAPC